MEMTENEREHDALAFYDDSSALAETREACWSKGPLSVCAKLASNDRIEIEIKLAGQRIGSGTISAANNRICASANVGLVKAKVCAIADFAKKEVSVEGEICIKKFPNGWKCSKFSAKILSW